MPEKTKISMVSYLNSKPFILGMELAGLLDHIELTLEIPSRSAEKLRTNQVDIALMPVAVLPKIPNAKIITNYCIGANGAVDSVYLFSKVPVNEIETIYLDNHSRTSARLLQLLCKEYWKIHPHFIAETEVKQELIQGKDACLMIGDKAIPIKNDYPYKYDLSEHWQLHTQLPFVFAAWVTTGNFPELEHQLNKAFALGLAHIDQLLPQYQHQYPHFDVKNYLKHSIDYQFDQEKQKALNLFLAKEL